MRRIVALVGVRGAGKSTLIAALDKHPNIVILTPTTNRPKRGDSEEYEFVEEFPHGNSMAWMIDVGDFRYGVRHKHIKSIPGGCVGVTVFDPGSITTLEEFRQQWTGEVVTVGLDTIENVAAQNARVQNDANRKMTSAAFDRQRQHVLKSDIVLHGDADLVRDATMAVCEILVSRGGLVGKNWLTPLIRAGALLDQAQLDEIEPASYDLRLGSEVWCQGDRHDLTEQEPFFKIPPYSYAIVKAEEIARIPRFMAGRFDLKVSLFFKGVLLSNGPQVDPGYEGALFCTLFNGRDAHAELKRGDHFATIEFCTLGNRVDGYIGQHQAKKKLNDFLPEGTGTGPGGNIIGRIGELEDQLGKVRTSTATYWWTMVRIFLAVLGGALAVLGVAVTVVLFSLNSLKSHTEKELDQIFSGAKRDIGTQLDEVSQVTSKAQAEATEKMQKLDQLDSKINQINKRLESLQSKLKTIEERSSADSGSAPSNAEDKSSAPPDGPEVP